MYVYVCIYILLFQCPILIYFTQKWTEVPRLFSICYYFFWLFESINFISSEVRFHLFILIVNLIPKIKIFFMQTDVIGIQNVMIPELCHD